MYSTPDLARELPNAQAIANATPNVPMVMIVKGGASRDNAYFFMPPGASGATRLLANSPGSLISELQTILQLRARLGG